MRKVFLDPGHGGQDTGAILDGFVESYFAWFVCLLARQELLAQGWAVAMSREFNEDPSPFVRQIAATQSGADCMISIHANAGVPGEHGPLVFYRDGFELLAAQQMIQALNRQGYYVDPPGTIPRPMQRQHHAVDQVSWKRRAWSCIAESKIPTVLLECEYLTDRDSQRWMIENISQIVRAICIGASCLKPLEEP
jgi:N-acetylmuramoyl-L-alanine amidase